MFKHLIAAVAALAMSSAAMAGVSGFDSGAEFSSTQGAGGWSYGYYSTAGDASSFTQFSYFDAASSIQWWEEVQVQSPWTLLWDTGGHPNSSSGMDHWAVRRWTSGAAGSLNLGIQYQAEDFGSTTVHVLVDGAQIFSGNTSSTLQTWSTTSPNVNVGSVVDFAIDANVSDSGDSTRLTAQGLVVTPVPEPETYALMLAGIGMLSAAARRQKKSA